MFMLTYSYIIYDNVTNIYHFLINLYKGYCTEVISREVFSERKPKFSGQKGQILSNRDRACCIVFYNIVEIGTGLAVSCFPTIQKPCPYCDHCHYPLYKPKYTNKINEIIRKITGIPIVSLFRILFQSTNSGVILL